MALGQGELAVARRSPYGMRTEEEPKLNKHSVEVGGGGGCGSSRVRLSWRSLRWALQWLLGFWCCNVKRLGREGGPQFPLCLVSTPASPHSRLLSGPSQCPHSSSPSPSVSPRMPPITMSWLLALTRTQSSVTVLSSYLFLWAFLPSAFSS